MMSRGVEERDVRLAVGKFDGLHQITPLIQKINASKEY
jgi:hypothetical protein